MWMLYLTQTHISVPALMGTLMCIGLTTANSILVVTFANQRMDAGDEAATAAVAAGYTRLRPVLMTAGAMILGMIPMSLWAWAKAASRTLRWPGPLLEACCLQHSQH